MSGERPAHDALAFDAGEQAAMYAAGAMTPAEMAAFEARLLRGDADARRAHEALALVRAAIEKNITPAKPRPLIKEQLMARVRSDVKRAPVSSPDPLSPLFTLRAGQTPWEETGTAGCRYRTLFVDEASRRMTVLFQLDAGAEYPDHHHAGVEECYVIAGDLHIAGTVLYAGDYHRAQGDTDHGESFTRGGCLLLITAPAA